MSKVLTPRRYQELAVPFLYNLKRANLWAGMGMGKTAIILMLLDAMRMNGDLDTPTLVLAPLRVARDTWPAESRKWEQYEHLDIRNITGDEAARRRALRAKIADIYSINYENLPWLVETLGENNWPFGCVIADESTRLKGFRLKGQGGQRAAALEAVAHRKVRQWVNLTGTPSPNGLKDLWGQNWFIDHGKRLGLTHSDFSRRWFRRKGNGYGQGIEPMPHSDREIHEIMRDISLTLDPKDWFDIRDPIVTTIPVYMPANVQAFYKELEKELFATLESGEDVEVFNEAALCNKCLQVANGAVYLSYPQWKAVHDEKLDALESIREEAGGMPLLVAYQFKSDVARIKERFKDSVILSDPKGFKAFMAGDAAMGLAHPASMGHGIDGLQNVTNILVRFGRGWDLEQQDQMLGRIGPVRQAQAGHDREVRVYDIVTQGTIDVDVVDRHITKASVQDALLAAAKRAH